MTKFKKGDKVKVLMSQNITTIRRAFTRTEHNGVVTSLYELDGRASDVHYQDDDLELYVEEVEEVSTVPSANRTSNSITENTNALISQNSLINIYLDDTPTHRHEDTSSNYSTYSSSDDSSSYSSGSSDSGSSSSSD